MEEETLRRATAGTALAVGAGAVLAPARLLCVYGVEPGALGGVGAHRRAGAGRTARRRTQPTVSVPSMPSAAWLPTGQ